MQVYQPLRTKAFCLASLVLMQVELEGHSLCPSAVSCPHYGTFLLLVLKVNHTMIQIGRGLSYIYRVY